jgi:hypothetical protein
VRKRFRLNLRSTQERTDDPSLPVQVVSSNAQHLPLSNHLRRLDPLNNRPRSPLRPRSLLRRSRRFMWRWSDSMRLLQYRGSSDGNAGQCARSLAVRESPPDNSVVHLGRTGGVAGCHHWPMPVLETAWLPRDPASRRGGNRPSVHRTQVTITWGHTCGSRTREVHDIMALPYETQLQHFLRECWNSFTVMCG